jgi:hypothetical protein
MDMKHKSKEGEEGDQKHDTISVVHILNKWFLAILMIVDKTHHCTSLDCNIMKRTSQNMIEGWKKGGGRFSFLQNNELKRRTKYYLTKRTYNDKSNTNHAQEGSEVSIAILLAHDEAECVTKVSPDENETVSHSSDLCVNISDMLGLSPYGTNLFC